MNILHSIKRAALPALVLAALLAGCGSQPGSTLAPAATATRAPRAGALTPYHTPTLTLTAAPTRLVTPSPVPTLTPTPRTHTVAKGEDMFGIAYRYHITLDELKAANPQVNPKFLSIGQQLIIPPASQPEPTSPAEAGAAATPTLVPARIGAPHCLPSAEGGAWCFAALKNEQDYTLENVSAVFRPISGEAEQSAFLPLDLLRPGDTLPLFAYFPPPLPDGFQITAELVTSLPHREDDQRYVDVQMQNQQVMISEHGDRAQVSLELAGVLTSSRAGTVRVAAVLYDAGGSIIGVRRWDNDPDTPLEPGAPLPVSFEVYSAAGEIVRVELFAEARP